MITSNRVVVAAGVLGLAGYVFVYSTGRASPPIRSDGFSYYVYLTSWLIYHDSTLASVARDCCGGDFPSFTAISRWPGTRRWVDAHPIGVAIMQTPFFLAAHALTRWSNLSPDGFSLYYQHAAGLSGLAWVVAGLWVLGDFLRRHFSDGVTAVTLGTLLFGTNLFHYATFDSSYSHPYSFFLFAALLNLTDRWHERGEHRPVLLGLVAALIVLTRHTIEIPLRAVFDSPSDWPIAATVTVDDRQADRLLLTDETWRSSRIRLPSPGRRRVRRIDIRADHTRAGNRGLQVGEVKW